MGYSVHKSMAIPFLFLLLGSGTVYLAGLAAVQASCVDGTTGMGPGGRAGEPGVVASGAAPLNTDGLSGVWGYSSSVLACNQHYRFHWFIAAWTLLTTLVCLIVAMAPGVGLAATRPFWTAILAVTAVLAMIASEAHLAALSSPGFIEESPRRRMRTAAAGAIMSAITAVLAMMGVGSVWGNERAHLTPATMGGGAGYERGGERVGRDKPASGLPMAHGGMAPAGV